MKCFIGLFCKVIAKTTNNSVNLKLSFKFSNNLSVEYCNVTLNSPVLKQISKTQNYYNDNKAHILQVSVGIYPMPLGLC